jgi:2'-5' RNA ligase
MLRTFIAIELSDETRNKLRNIISSLRTINYPIKWVDADRIHLTLKFLGATRDEQVPQIINVMEEHLNNYPPFEYHIGGISTFGSKQAPRVIWVGITKGIDKLKHIADTLNEAMGNLGFPSENREYVPHLTIGRNRCSRPADKLLSKIKTLSVDATEYAGEVTLIESKLKPSGPVYTPLGKVVFGD